MTVFATRLFCTFTALRVADRADWLDVVMMFSSISFIMIVLMPSLALLPDVPAISTREQVRVRAASGSNLDVDALAGLPFVSVPRRMRSGSGHAGQRVQTEWHSAPSVHAIPEFSATAFLLQLG